MIPFPSVDAKNDEPVTSIVQGRNQRIYIEKGKKEKEKEKEEDLGH